MKGEANKLHLHHLLSCYLAFCVKKPVSIIYLNVLLLLVGCVNFRQRMPAKADAVLAFATTAEPAGAYVFRRSSPGDEYLANLRITYKLDNLVAGKKTDFERVQAVCAWVHRQWKHNGSNEPQHYDPVSILQEAAQGKRFRCVEYGIVLTGALSALGIPARTLGLGTADVETRKARAGHVLAEAWLADQRKWMLVDGQWDVIPLLNGVPLNAVELQRALAGHERGLTVASPAGTSAKRYGGWIRPYLFYFDTSLDGRIGVSRTPGQLFLVPVGAANPARFQGSEPVKNRQYTHSLAAFYAPPQ